MATWTFPYCPTPPHWSIDWPAIQERFAWIGAMAGVPQDPLHHAEGDVLTHTRMVTEALVALTEWRNLSADNRALLFAAALLHDVAKPACTRTDEDGRITSPRHARVGASMARTILLLGADLVQTAPLLQRETITRLVQYHGLPLWWFDKGDPERAVIGASQSVRLDWLALLAEADVRGHICADQRDLLDRVALFREFCQETACYIHPRRFASDHSRFVYFHNQNPDPTYTAYDTTTFEVILMCGLPGAGKDTWISHYAADWPVISLDQLRAEINVAPDQSQGEVVQLARTRARDLLRQQRPFVWNATNITLSLRRQIIDLVAAYQARVRIVYVDAPFATLLQRNRLRNQQNAVPEPVIRKLLRRLDVPDLTEAHQVEWIDTSA